MFRLTDDNDTEKMLLQQPETGMGYQIAHMIIDERDIKRAVVFNAELVIEYDELVEVEPEGRADASYEDVLKDAKKVEGKLVEMLNLSQIPPPTGGEAAPPGILGPLAPTPFLRQVTTVFEGFARLSAYPNDKRVTRDQELLPNTYATTVNDLKEAPSGFAAVGRYSLPNPWPAEYVYVIVPGAGREIISGTVRPAFHQAGGGAEVLFKDRTPKGSVMKPYAIPIK